MKNKTLTLDTVIITDDVEIIRSKLVALDWLITKNPDYFYESEVFIGPPHRIELKLYKNE